MHTAVGLMTFAVAAGTFGTGLVVLLKNPSDKQFRYLFFIAVSFSLWMISNFFSNNDTLTHNIHLLANRLIFVFSSGAVGLVPVFFGNITKSVFMKKYNNIYIGLVGFLMILSITPWVVKDITPTSTVTEVDFGFGGLLYFVGLLFFISSSIVLLWSGRKKASGRGRTQLQIIGWATCISLVFSLITNSVLPYVFGEYYLSLFGPLFFSIMVTGYAYAIVRKQLYDIRLAVVRSVAYLSIVITLGVLYILFFNQFATRFYTQETEKNVKLFSAFFSIILIFTFQPIWRLFNLLSTRLFYRDSYDLRSVLEELSGILVDQGSLESISNQSLNLLSEALHPSEAHLIIFSSKNTLYHATYRSRKFPTGKVLYDNLSTLSEIVTYTESTRRQYIKKLRKTRDVDLILKLSTQQSVVGVLLLGPKARGDVYTKQDVELLTICAKNLGLALENAKRFNEISRFSKTLKEEIENATQKLIEANAQLQKLDRIKNDLISATSHQLRPRLTAAEGFLSLIDESSRSQLHRVDKENLEFARKSIVRMMHIVGGILEVAGEDKVEIKLNKEAHNIYELVEDTIRQFGADSKRRIRLISDDDAQKRMIRADRFKIEESIHNLIQNALDYSTKEVKVQVAVNKNKPPQVEIAVSDRGIGINEVEVKKVFSKLYRSKKAKLMNPAGTGVGLHVVKMFIEAHGGKVIIDSRKGIGSTFRLLIPY